jgi:hypothetical protein
MNKHRLLIAVNMLLLCMFTSGCITIEQEIYLQPDGSGEMMLHFSLPDLPEEAKKSPMGKDGPENMLEKMKQEIGEKLPPTIKLKSAKEVKQNGMQNFYAVFEFKDIKDVEGMMKAIFKETTKDAPSAKKDASEWTMAITKEGKLTTLTQRFFADLSDSKVESSGLTIGPKKEPEPAPEVKPAPKPAPRTKARAGGRKGTRPAAKPAPAQEPDAPPPPADPFGGMMAQGMDKMMEQLIFSVIKFRFVIHAPGPINASNADIVMRGNTAYWECSLGAFAKDKKPIEMKVSY